MAAFTLQMMSLAAPQSASMSRTSLAGSPLRASCKSQASCGRRRLSVNCAAVSADLGGLMDEVSVPTPVTPSASMMADFLMTYNRMLKHAWHSGDYAASAGSNVLERVRVGVLGLFAASQDQKENRLELQLEDCLRELEKDIDIMQRFPGSQRGQLAVQLASIHCAEAARLLRQF